MSTPRPSARARVKVNASSSCVMRGSSVVSSSRMFSALIYSVRDFARSSGAGGGEAGTVRLLLTNTRLAERGGSELYLRDVALALRERGHAPIAFSTVLGEVADELRSLSVPVVDDLSTVVEPPDLVHGQHHLETMTALLHFPDTPAVYFRHGPVPWEEWPPRFPRLLRYVTTTPASRQVVAMEHHVPLERIEVIPNFVDLRRFAPRGPLPQRAQRALIFSNHASHRSHVPAVRDACTRVG